MTPEYGAPSQLEKIDMLDLADVVVLNKSDRRGAQDALRDVTRQWRRNRGQASGASSDAPVFPTIAARWNDPGMDRLFEALSLRLADPAAALAASGPLPEPSPGLIPGGRARYLAEIAEAVRDYRDDTTRQAELARTADALGAALEALGDPRPAPAAVRAEATAGTDSPALLELRDRYDAALEALDPGVRSDLADWPDALARYRAETQGYQVRDREIPVENHTETLSGTRLPRVALPPLESLSELVRYKRLENLPGYFPFTAGVFPFKRAGEDPTRMFAGEGSPERTNARFHYVSRGQPAARLSTAFDSVTLYGRDPGQSPDVYGKVGNSGVSICTVEDAVKLYSGFDLTSPSTSVSMTINGPAPILLAFFLNAAIDQNVERHLRETGERDAVRERFARRLPGGLPEYAGALPEGSDGLGLGLLGIAGEEAVDRET
jgi:methylmalonyl-CoA mutase